MNTLEDFVGTGELGPLRLGMPYEEVVRLLGEPDGTTGAEPLFCAYGDVQLGFDEDRRLWHIAVEPAGDRVGLPVGPAGGGSFPVPALADVVARVRRGGGAVSACEPFSPGETWHRVHRSGVLLHEDDGGLVDQVHLSQERGHPSGKE